MVQRRFARFFLVASLNVFSLQVWAAGPSITAIGGVSSYVGAGTATAYAFGGMAGTCQAQDQNGINVCNSCTVASATCSTTPLCACNPASIYDTLMIVVPFADGTGTGFACAAAQPGTQGGTKTLMASGTSTTTSVSFTWADVCSRLNNTPCNQITTTAALSVDFWVSKAGACNPAPASGEEVTTISFKVASPPAGDWDVYTDAGTTQEGVKAFHPYPGDGKVRIEDMGSVGSFPNLSYGVKAAKLEVFMAEGGIENANYQSKTMDPVELDIIEDGGTLSSDIVDNLENDHRYYFRIALKDEAGNIVQYFPQIADTTTPSNPDCVTGAANPANCYYSAVPSQVLGLLSKDLNCFIATAAYGSSLEPKIQTFRIFRHKFLLTNPWGLEFVRSYYHYGPLAARWISDKPAVRFLVRGGLWPLWGFSYMAVNFGLPFALSISLFMIGSLLAALYFMMLRWPRRA